MDKRAQLMRLITSKVPAQPSGGSVTGCELELVHPLTPYASSIVRDEKGFWRLYGVMGFRLAAYMREHHPKDIAGADDLLPERTYTVFVSD